MVMRIRFSVHGLTHRKFFNIVAIRGPLRRNAKPTEVLGTYDPHVVEEKGARSVQWSVGRILHWLDVGAQPSEPVARLLELGGILKPGSPYRKKSTIPKHPVIKKIETPNPRSKSTSSKQPAKLPS